jgi:hypothetical protein
MYETDLFIQISLENSRAEKSIMDPVTSIHMVSFEFLLLKS